MVTKLLKCPECKKTNGLRVNVMQDVDVEIDINGTYHNGCNFSDPDLDDDTGEVYCSNCDNFLLLTADNKLELKPDR